MPLRSFDSRVTPFNFVVAEREIQDIYMRLDHVRWPEAQTVSDWSQGIPLSEMLQLVEYWRHKYDWRRCERRLNSLPQFKTELEGLDIYFLHVRSSQENALPLILTHGWPGSILEFDKVIGPLSEPQNFGGDRRDAFHLVIPALPGYGFSSKPIGTGWGLDRIAANWNVLMERLGYHEYVAQGGDWGAAVTHALARQQPKGLKAIHTNLPIVMPPPPYENLSSEESAMLQDMLQYQRWESGYSGQQMSRPQTLGYSLADSPVGQAAWIFEKFRAWSDCDGDPLTIFSYDELLDNIMLYWLTNSATSSARLYWESFDGAFVATESVPIPCGYSIFPKEIYRAPRSWAERFTPQLIHWNQLDKGGHFAAFEQPNLFAQELRDCFRKIR
ncbi:epoxide hydrolase family protein [Citrobacter freundii]|uniref:epoxide hydrolase family protein n=1 Tax=Citrobacter TaxID=544 RepID=UPI00157561F1|nr:epoxide hydrolase family protein [Citrobacter freundii]NTY76567.1 epoxide hydrolase [Citrobacter freundii]NUA13015.1 epoxide hydrolase [Citrobacter freundii]HAT7542468.1 epoxide hydrolase [Citrobacter freundii]HAT7574204.1 epoxide hydrolase [Citrobacter freundii]